MDKLVIYTALFGNYDNLFEPKKAYANCDFICFTDQENLKSNIWDFVIVGSTIDSPSMENRKYKLNPHKYLSNYKSSLYIDANIIIKKNPYDLVKSYLEKSNFLMPKHPLRNCIYEEAKICAALNLAPIIKSLKQVKKYRKIGFPESFGLGENNILLRNHNNTEVIKLMKTWSFEINNETQRDQLSLGYALWKNNQNFCHINENTRLTNNFFGYINHRNSLPKFYLVRLMLPFKFRFRKYIYKLLNIFIK